LTRSIGIPWQHISADLEIGTDERGNYQSYRASGIWEQPFSVVAEGIPELPTKITPFQDTNEAIGYLVRPLMGFFGQRGKTRGFRIWHPEVQPHGGLVKQVHFPLLKTLNLIDESAINKPDSILLVPNAYFNIYMPPEKVRIK
jgi:hypothetical protein